MDSDHTLSGVRTRMPSLTALRNSCDDFASTLDGLLQINPSEFSQNEETLNNFGRDLKHTLNNFLNASRSLSERLQSSGSMDASFKVRQERINKRKDAQEVLDAVNHFKKALGADLFSNFESSTQASSEMPPETL